MSYFSRSSLFNTTLLMWCSYIKAIEKVFIKIKISFDSDSSPLSVAAQTWCYSAFFSFFFFFNYNILKFSRRLVSSLSTFQNSDDCTEAALQVCVLPLQLNWRKRGTSEFTLCCCLMFLVLLPFFYSCLSLHVNPLSLVTFLHDIFFLFIIFFSRTVGSDLKVVTTMKYSAACKFCFAILSIKRFCKYFSATVMIAIMSNWGYLDV